MHEQNQFTTLLVHRFKTVIIRNKTLLSILLTLSITSSIFVATPYVFGFLTGKNIMSTSGIIADVTLGVFSDDNCTQNLASIDWGICYPGQSIVVEVYIKNLGTVDSLLLIEAINWGPPTITSYLVFSENGSGNIINPEEVLQVSFILDILPVSYQVETFFFDVLITSQG